MALTYNQIKSLTTNKLMPKVVDNIYDSKAIIKRMTMLEKMKMLDGGIQIQVPVYHAKISTSGLYYSASETLASAETDDATSAVYDWKYIQVPVRISRAQLLQNKGDSAKISLLVAKMKHAENAMTDSLGLGIFSDGTSATGALTNKQLTGLALMLSTTSTLGGIAVADMSTWIAKVVSNSSTARNLTLNLCQETFGGASIDNEKPTAAYTTQKAYDQLWALFQPSQRIINAESKNLGFPSLEFNGIPVFVDSHVYTTSSTNHNIIFINENHTFLAAHKDEWMRIEEFDKLETYNGILNRILCMTNLVCDARRLNGILQDVLVTA